MNRFAHSNFDSGDVAVLLQQLAPSPVDFSAASDAILRWRERSFQSVGIRPECIGL